MPTIPKQKYCKTPGCLEKFSRNKYADIYCEKCLQTKADHGMSIRLEFFALKGGGMNA